MTLKTFYYTVDKKEAKPEDQLEITLSWEQEDGLNPVAQYAAEDFYVIWAEDDEIWPIKFHLYDEWNKHLGMFTVNKNETPGKFVIFNVVEQEMVAA